MGASAILLAAVLIPSVAGAQQWQSARLIGRTGAQRAQAGGTDALVLNPAGMALDKKYIIEMGYADDFRQGLRRFNVSITDGQAGPVAGGVSYTYGRTSPEDPFDGEEQLEGHRIEGGLAVAVPKLPGFAMGANLRGLFFQAINTSEDSDLEDLNEFTFDVGIQWRVSEQVAIGVSGQNLTNIDREEAPLRVGGGVGVTFGDFELEGDGVYDLFIDNVILSASAAYTLSKVVPVRGGVVWDPESQEIGFSVGAGVMLGPVGIDVAYAQRLTNNDDSEGDDQRIFVVGIRGVLFQ